MEHVLRRNRVKKKKEVLIMAAQPYGEGPGPSGIPPEVTPRPIPEIVPDARPEIQPPSEPDNRPDSPPEIIPDIPPEVKPTEPL
jgi:hypothetical protein